MATQNQVSAVIDIILKVFGNDAESFEKSLEAIKINTDRVDIDNKIATIRKEMQAYNEQMEAQIQELLGMK